MDGEFHPLQLLLQFLQRPNHGQVLYFCDRVTCISFPEGSREEPNGFPFPFWIWLEQGDSHLVLAIVRVY